MPEWELAPDTSSAPEWADKVDLEFALRNAALTSREKQVCQARLDGKTLAEWAAEQRIDAATARWYWSEARRKLRRQLD